MAESSRTNNCRALSINSSMCNWMHDLVEGQEISCDVEADRRSCTESAANLKSA